MQPIIDFFNSTELTAWQQILLTVITFCVMAVFESTFANIFKYLMKKVKQLIKLMIKNIRRIRRMYRGEISTGDYFKLNKKRLDGENLSERELKALEKVDIELQKAFIDFKSNNTLQPVDFKIPNIGEDLVRYTNEPYIIPKSTKPKE